MSPGEEWPGVTAFVCWLDALSHLSLSSQLWSERVGLLDITYSLPAPSSSDFPQRKLGRLHWQRLMVRVSQGLSELHCPAKYIYH